MIRAGVKGKALHFDYDSMVGSNEVFKDRETGSLWQQSLSMATSGPLKGTHLQLYPFLLTQWGEWRKQHPETLVLKPLPGYADHLAAMNRYITEQWRPTAPDTRPAPRGAFGNDDRLKPHAMILGLRVSDGEKAYPLSALRKERVINDKIAGEPVVVVHQPGSDTTTAFDPRHDAKILNFKAANAEANQLVDSDTQSSWNAYGLCVSGRLEGTQLKALVLEPEFWFAWSEFHPKAAVYGTAGHP